MNMIEPQAAFGISFGHPSGIVDLLRFVAKRVKCFKTDTNELIADLSGSEPFHYHLGGGEDVQLELELYDDIEGPKLLYGYYDCLDEEDFKLKEFPDFRIGFPTGCCGSMMYVAKCEHASEEPIPPETLRRLMDVYEKYRGSERMGTDAKICLKIRCCS